MNKREFRRQRLQALIDDRFNGVVADFARAVGKDQTYIARMLYPEDKPQAKSIGEKIIADIATALGIKSDWFDSDEDLPAVEIQPKYRIEILNEIEASAGDGVITADAIELISAIEYTEAQYFLMFNHIPADNIKVINVKGDSMSPTLESGDLLFIDIRVIGYEGDGIYVFSYGKNLYVKRLQMAGDQLLVLSDNKSYKEWSITEENEYKFKVHGKVLIGQSQAFKRYG